MITLDFKGPYHFNQINSINEIKKGVEPIDGKGIYIWGFMYKKENNSLGDEIHFKMEINYDPYKMQFIPYYVGKADDTSILNRLNSHHKPRYGHSTKYIRLSMTYMKSFFIGKPPYVFPINFKNNKDCKNNYVALELINKNPNLKLITYFNNADCLSAIYPEILLKSKRRIQNNKAYNNYPITMQHIPKTINNPNGDLPDTLDDLINTKYNFWFYYALKPESANITEMETFTFWSLKGITVSETQKFETVKLYDIKNRDNTIFKDEPSEEFNGY
jgi:hypothetical protein